MEMLFALCQLHQLAIVAVGAPQWKFGESDYYIHNNVIYPLLKNAKSITNIAVTGPATN